MNALISVSDKTGVLDLARAEQRFPPEALAEVEAFLNDPAAWRQQHGG